MKKNKELRQEKIGQKTCHIRNDEVQDKVDICEEECYQDEEQRTEIILEEIKVNE